MTLGSTLSNVDIATQTELDSKTIDQLSAPTAPVSFGNQRITGVGAPTAATDAATKAYADSVAAGLDVKASVRVATTANITLSGAQTIDGVAVVATNRVLVKNQTTGSQNGIYVAAAGAWARSTDADVDAEVNAGMFTFVEQGTAHGDQGWVLTTNNPITVGTTSLVFTQFSGVGGSAADIVFAGFGAVTVGPGVNRYRMNSTVTIVGATAMVNTAPTGATLIVDVNKNGTTIFSTQGNRPTIAAAGFDSGIKTPDVTSLVAGDYLTVDIDQIGSTVAGSDLTVQVIVRPA